MFENKNTKQFNTLFSFLTFGLIGVLIITSLYILITVMLFKIDLQNIYNKNPKTYQENVMYYSKLIKDANNYILGVGVTPVGAGLFFLVSLSFALLVGYSVIAISYKPNCLRKNPIIWTIALLSFSVFVMFILAMLGNVWDTEKSAIIKSFVLIKVIKKATTENSEAIVTFQYGGASLTVLLFDIVIYCCLIISITHIIKDLVKLSKNDFVVNQELSVNL